MADYELSDEQLLAIQEDEDKKDRLTQAAVGFSAGAPAGMGQAAMKAADPGPVSDLAKAYHRSIKYIGTNPDKFAADAKLANDSGSPLKLIQSDENVRADAVRRSLYNKGRVPRYEQLNRIEKNNPATNRFLKRPGNIPMISDDPESLARGEDLITTAVNGYKSGDLQQRLGRLQFQNIINGDSESVNKEIDGIKSQLKEMGPEPEGLGGRMFYGAGQMLAQRRDQVARGAWYASAATLAAGLTFGTMGLGAPVGGAMLAVGAGTGVLGGLAAMGPTQVAAGAAKAGFTAGASMEGLIQEAGLGYDELRDIRGENGEKLDPSVARAGGLIIGAVNAGIEFAQLDTWMKSIPGLKKIFTSEVAKKAAQIPLVQSYLKAAGKAGLAYLKTLGVESGQEVWQQTTNIAVRNAAKALSPGKFKYDKASDIFYELADTFGSSAIQFSIPMMVGPLMEGAQNIHKAAVTREYHISRAKGLSAIQQMMNNAAKDTPLAKRSPEKLGEFLSGVNDQLRNPFSSVFLPASAVQAYVDEKNMSAEQRSDLIEGLFGIKTDDFDASLSGGSDITIGSDKFALLNEQNEELGKRLFPELKAEADGIAIKDIDKAAETHKNTLRDEIRFTTAAAIGTQNAEDLAKMAENSGLDRVYVAPQAVQQLFQTATPEAKQQTLDAIGVSEADFDAALENNEDVEISTEKLLNGGVPTEVYKTLKDDLRAEPGAMTLRDARNYEQTSAEQFGAEDTKSWRARVENTLSSIESAMKVKANMKAQLTLSGYADDVAENSAKVWAGHIMRSAQRIGVSPEEYAKIYANMKFVRGEKGEGLMQAMGQRGAKALDAWEGVTTRMDNLALAKQELANGADMKAIKYAYGWEKGPDGLWRFESDDRQSVFNFDNVKTTALLSNYIDNNELYTAYPFLRDTNVVFEKMDDDNIYGKWYKSQNLIVINEKMLEGLKQSDEADNFSRPLLEKTLLHEIQHAIQDKEGFARGGSPDEFNSRVVDNPEYIRYDKNARDAWNRIPEEFKNDARALNRLFASGNELADDDPHEARIDANKEAADAWWDYLYARGMQQKLSSEGKLKVTLRPEDIYHNLAGEVEARNAARRRNMTPEERRNSLFADTADVAPESLIVLNQAADKAESSQRVQELFQSVWHGSPQDFDLFSLEHIGEGEGAQAYGWGLYFAGKREVSEWYKKNLSSNRVFVGNEDISDYAYRLADGSTLPFDERAKVWIARNMTRKVHGNLNEEINSIIDTLKFNIEDSQKKLQSFKDYQYDDKNEKQHRSRLSYEKRLKSDLGTLTWFNTNKDKIKIKDGGQLFKVDIPDDNGNYLLWDKKVSDEQAEQLVDALAQEPGDVVGNWVRSERKNDGYVDLTSEEIDDEYYPSDILKDYVEQYTDFTDASGEDIYRQLSAIFGSDKEASLFLKRNGIVGIKYLDGTSRRIGEGSYNYVIFDDKAVTVLQKLYQSVRAIKDAVTIDTKKMGNFNTKFDYSSYSFDGLNNEQKTALAQKIASDAKLSSSEKIRLADAAINYYSEKIQGHPITNRYIGDVEFTGRGKNHFREKNSNYLKYYMIPFLPQLVETAIPMTNPENGTYDFGVKPYREDKESKKTKTVHSLTTTLVAFNYLQNTVDIDGNVYNIKIDIEKWSDGKKYYDITGLDKLEKGNKKDSSPVPTGLADNGTAYSAEQESFNNSPAPTGTSVTRVPGPTESGSAPVSTETAGNSALSPSDRNNNNVAQSDNSGNIELTQVNAGQTRGSILLPQQFGGGVPIQVTITPSANSSTAIHEMSHYFLWETAHLAELAPGDFELQNDLATIKNWLGWQDSQTEWTVEQQEKWARGFEAYMREGKAPSVELMGAFGRFRKWLCDIYKTMTELNVELTDDVRAVFGRMLATEEQTAEASSAYSMGGGEAEGGVVEQIVNAAANKQRASDAERSKAGILATILDEYESRMAEQKSAEYAEARKNVTDDVISMPVYRAMAAMENRPELKLSSDMLAEEYGNGVFTDLPKEIYAADGTATADEVAEQFGYESGDEMLKAIRTAPTIEQETAARLKALFGEDVPADERVGQMAEDDAYSKESVTPLMMEREGLTEAQGASNEEWDEILRQDEEARAEADSPRSRPNVLRWIRDNGGLNYESVVGVFGKEQAQELLKKVGPGLFKKTGMGLDVAAESMTNEGALFGTNGVNADQDVFNILMGEDPPVSPLEVARREGFAEARKYARQQAEKRRAAARERQKAREERKKQASAFKEEKTKAVAEEKAFNKELRTAAKEGRDEARSDAKADYKERRAQEKAAKEEASAAAKAAEEERKAEERDAREAARQFAWESNQADLYEQRQDDKQHREALKQRAQMNGEAVLRAARDEVNRIKATQVDDRVKVYRAAEARARRECSAAMKDRDWERAMNAKDREILNHALAAEAKQAAKDLQNARVRIMEQQKRTPKNSGGITQEYIDQIDLLFSRYSLKEESPRINAIPGLDSFCLSEERAGRPCPVAAWLRNGTVGKEWTSFSTGELRDFDDTLKWLIYSGREANRLSKEFATRNLGAVAENISGVILHNLVKLVANNNLKLAKNKDYDLSSRERITGRLAKLLSSLTKIEFITHILDAGERQGPVWDALFRPISEAEDSETLMSKKYSGEFEKLLNDTFDKKERRLMSKKKYYDMIGKNLSKEQVLAIALNMGNRTNRERILSGFGWNEQQLRYVVESTLSEKDWKFVQATWDLIDTLWPQVARLQRDIVGFLPERVEADMFFVRPKDWKVNKGYQLRGGYYPIAYNRESRQNRFIRIVSERQAMEDIFEGQWSYAMTKHGHTESRVKSTGFELRLDLGVVSEHINNVIHDLAYRKAIIDVNKILRYAYTDETGARHAPVEEAIIGSMGEEIYNQFQPWLQSIARDEVQPTNDFEHLFRWLRRRTQVVVLGLKAAVSLSQGLGWFPAAAEVGGYRLAKNILYFYRNPLSVQEKAQEVLAKSESMRVRTDARDRDLRTLVHDLRREGKFNSIQETYFWFINLFDAGVVLPVWLTAYEKGMKTNGWDEKRAIAYADGVVRNTQDIGTPKDLAAVQRGTDSWKIFTMFYNAMNTQANMLIEQAWLARAGHTTKARMLGTMMYVVVLPAIAGALLSGQGPKPDDGGDDDENKLAKYFKWGAGEAAKYPFSFVPLLRDFANAAFGDYEFRGSAAFSPMSETAKAIRNVTKVAEDYEETDEINWRKLSTSLLTASGYAFGLPAGQMKITLNALLDWLEGDKEVKPQDFFLYRKR